MKKIMMMAAIAVIAVSCCNKANEKLTIPSEWTLEKSVYGKHDSKTLLDKGATLFFKDSTSVVGNDGTNNFFGNFSCENKCGNTCENISIKPMGSTRMASPWMSSSDSLTNALSNVTSYSIKNGKLILTDANKSFELIYAPKK